jgi:hypothetical protein
MLIALLVVVILLVGLVVWQTHATSTAHARAALAEDAQRRLGAAEDAYLQLRASAVAEADALRAAAAQERERHFQQLQLVEERARNERAELYARMQGQAPPPLTERGDVGYSGSQKLNYSEDDEIRADLGQAADDYTVRLEGALAAAGQAARAEGMELQ